MSGHEARLPRDAFWGEMPACDHSLQLYEDDAELIGTLAGFVGGGLANGEGVIVIATPAHLDHLERRLTESLSGFSLAAARERDQYLALEADSVLSRFMINGMPDASRFASAVRGLLERARGLRVGGEGQTRRVRAFGEMVALLWSRGQAAATLELERLWDGLCRAEGFPLFCAYPRAGFGPDAADPLREICQAHSRMVFPRPPHPP
jgi:hypothetical protein